MDTQECKVCDLHEFGRGIVVRMIVTSIKKRSIPPVDSSTPAGLMNVSTSSGMLISPTMICIKTSSCQMTKVFIKVTRSLFVVGLLPLNAMIAATTSSVRSAIGRMTILVIIMPIT